jgi:hypothetical protein
VFKLVAFSKPLCCNHGNSRYQICCVYVHRLVKHAQSVFAGGPKNNAPECVDDKANFENGEYSGAGSKGCTQVQTQPRFNFLALILNLVNVGN